MHRMGRQCLARLGEIMERAKLASSSAELMVVAGTILAMALGVALSRFVQRRTRHQGLLPRSPMSRRRPAQQAISGRPPTLPAPVFSERPASAQRPPKRAVLRRRALARPDQRRLPSVASEPDVTDVLCGVSA